MVQNGRVIRPRSAPAPLLWALLGVGAGLVGLTASYAAEMFFTLHRPLMSVVASMAAGTVPVHAHEVAVKYLALNDLPFFVFLLVLAGCLVCAWGGAGGRLRWWKPVASYTALAGVAAVAVATQTPGRIAQYLCLALGWVLALVVYFGLAWLLRRHLRERETPSAAAVAAPEPDQRRVVTSRRTLLGAVGVIAVVTVAGGLTARSIGTARRRTAGARSLVRLPAMNRPVVPAGAQSALPGAAPWRTPNQTFYVRDTALRTPTVDPNTWLLRVHGMVHQELTLTYADLVTLPVTERWITLSCAENEIGGDLAGNAWWTGVRVADVLRWAGVRDRAEVVVQTSEDGWQCTTDLAALLERDALLAFGMNGEVLPTEHGFPVRTVVPGMVGDASACKWLVDLEVTRAEPLAEGADPEPPLEVGLQARVDLVHTADPDAESGTEPVPDGVIVQGTLLGHDLHGARAEIQFDDGPWQVVSPMSVQDLPTDVWRQFEFRQRLVPGRHTVQVRALSGSGRRSEPDRVEVEVPEPGEPVSE